MDRLHRTRATLAAAVVAAVALASLGSCAPANPTPASTGRLASVGAALASPSGRPPSESPSVSPSPVQGSPSPRAAASPTGPLLTATPGVTHDAGRPRYDHVIWIWMENREASAITATSAPYLTTLARTYGYAASYFAIGHPSEPNYIAAVAGSTAGVTDDGSYDLAHANLFDQLTAAGLTWRVYAQDYPGSCFGGSSYTGGPDGPGPAGTYVRKHNPAISFTSISGSPAACARIEPLHRFSPTVASFELIVPNLTNDMHDGSTATGDAFLGAFVPGILASPDWARTVLILTFDEGVSQAGQDGDNGGQVFTVVVREGLLHAVSRQYYDHYSLLRTTEAIFGLPLIGAATSRAAMSDLVPQ